MRVIIRGSIETYIVTCAHAHKCTLKRTYGSYRHARGRLFNNMYICVCVCMRER